MPCFGTTKAIGWVIALDEVGQVREAHGLFLQGVVNIGAVVVVPDFLCSQVFAGFVVIEKEHVRLYTIGVKNTGRQAENGVQVSILHELLANGLARATFEQNIIGDRQREVELDAQTFPIVIINHVEGTKAAAIAKLVGHKIHALARLRKHCFQGLQHEAPIAVAFGQNLEPGGNLRIFIAQTVDFWPIIGIPNIRYDANFFLRAPL